MQPVWQEKILVVDDSAPIVSLLKAVLRDAGEVEIAVNGQDALEKTKQHYYRLIASCMAGQQFRSSVRFLN